MARHPSFFLPNTFEVPVDDSGAIIPAFQEIMSLPFWVVWVKGDADSVTGKFPKLPWSPITRKMKEWDQPGNQGTFEQAFEAAHVIARISRNQGRDVGLGIYPHAVPGAVTASDFDYCLDEHGKLLPWASEIIKPEGELLTYTERSPSGKGIRTLMHRPCMIATTYGNIESYDGTGPGRFVTITGRIVKSSPRTINEAKPIAFGLYARAALLMPKASTADAFTAVQGEDDPPPAAAAVQQKPAASKRRAQQLEALTPISVVNALAMSRLDAWVPEVLPAAEKHVDGYRVTSKALGRATEEDLSIAAEGIKDFGVHDLGDDRTGKRSPVDLLMSPYQSEDSEHYAADPMAAAHKLAALIGVPDAMRQFVHDHTARAFGNTEPVDVFAPKPGRDVAPQWPEGILPPSLESYCHNVARCCGGDVNAALALAATVPATVLSPSITFKPKGPDDGWSNPPAFYVGLVGAPGTTKSPILSTFLKPLTEMDKEALKAFEITQEEYALQRDNFEAAMRDYKVQESKRRRRLGAAKARAKKSGDAPIDDDPLSLEPADVDAPIDEVAADLTSMPEPQEPTPPVPPKDRVVTATTTEGVARFASRNGGSVVVYADELQSFFGSIDQYRNSSKLGSADRGFWCSAYDDGFFKSVRSDETKNAYVSRLRASVFGGIQPGVLYPILSALSTDGLAQRMWLVPIRRTVEMSREPADVDGAKLYDNAVRILADLNLDAIQRECLVASTDALDMLYEVDHWRLNEARRYPENDPVQGVLSKTRGFVARLALALHSIEWAWAQAEDRMLYGTDIDLDPFPLEVTAATMDKAVRLWREFFWPNIESAYRAAREEDASSDIRHAARELLLLPRSERAGLSKSYLQRKPWRRWQGRADQIGALIEELTEANWLTVRRIKDSDRSRDVYDVNPAIYDGRFANYLHH